MSSIVFYILGLLLYVAACMYFGSAPVVIGLIAGLCMAYGWSGLDKVLNKGATR